MRSLARFFRVSLTSGLVAALVIALLGPIAAFAVTSIGAQIQLSPLNLKQIDQPSTVYDDQGNLIATLSDADYSSPVDLNQVPPVVIKAVLDAEDKDFYKHGPIDIKSIIRAAEADIRHGHIVQGGSTITQQLVKNEVLTPKRTFARKITEIIDSYRLFDQKNRSWILQQYLNTVYFGNGAYGIEAAAKVYFQSDVGQLNPAQAAFLAGMIRNPTAYDPKINPRDSLTRRNEVIDQMKADNDLQPTISSTEAALMKLSPIPTTVTPPQMAPSSPFITEVTQALLADTSLGGTQTLRYNEVFKGGLKIYTTLDPPDQAAADAAVKKILPDTGGKFTSAMVAMDPSTGYVKAIVSGNPGTGANQGYDVATGRGGSGRQPGSSFKAIVLATALSSGIAPTDTVDGTSPCTFPNPGGQPYQAHNAEQGGGDMSVQDALTNSINCAFIRIGLAVGLQKVVTMAHSLGITSQLQPYPSISVGSEEVTPLQMATVYSTIEDGGVFHPPTFYSKIVDPTGNVLFQGPVQGHQALNRNDAQVETQMLRQVIEWGTGTAAQLPDGRQEAGKTGTTNDYTDAWFCGFVPQLAAAVWMGDPSGLVSMYDVGGITVFGGTYPAEIWEAFMQQALKGTTPENFTLPSFTPQGNQFIGGGIDETTTTSSTSSTTSSTSSTTPDDTTTTSTTPGSTTSSTTPGSTTSSTTPGTTTPTTSPVTSTPTSSPGTTTPTTGGGGGGGGGGPGHRRSSVPSE